jgi:hypothetical protein
LGSIKLCIPNGSRISAVPNGGSGKEGLIRGARADSLDGGNSDWFFAETIPGSGRPRRRSVSRVFCYDACK